jgi:hypothetical protein
MKITPAQQKIINMMNGGWNLGRSHCGRSWLQKGGIGRGGEVLSVRSDVFLKLYKNGFIKSSKWSFPTEEYILTKSEVPRG